MRVCAAAGEGLTVNGEVYRPEGVRTRTIPTLALGENDFEASGDTDQRAQALRADGYDVVRYRCSSFSLANAALGRLSGYVEHGTALWDVVAGAALCREAGLTVRYSELEAGRYAIEARWE